MKKIVRLTESDLMRLVKRIIKETPTRIDIGSHEDLKRHGRNTRWWPAREAGKEAYDSYTEKFGPFTVYINGDKKIICQGDECYTEMDYLLSSREEAAEYLGVNSLDDIM